MCAAKMKTDWPFTETHLMSRHPQFNFLFDIEQSQTSNTSCCSERFWKKRCFSGKNERHWTASKNRHRHRPRRWRRDGDFRRARASQASRSRHLGRHAGQWQHRRRQPSQEQSQNFCNCSRKPPISKMGSRYFTLLRFRTARYSRAINWYKKTLSLLSI